jgi:hypothetical protein
MPQHIVTMPQHIVKMPQHIVTMLHHIALTKKCSGSDLCLLLLDTEVNGDISEKIDLAVYHFIFLRKILLVSDHLRID